MPLTKVKRGLRRPHGWVAAGIALVAALGVLNFAAAMWGDATPWLQALDLAGDIALLAGLLVLIVFIALRTDAQREALDTTQARLAGIVDSAMDAIITVDAKQQIVLFNRAAEEMLRCTRDDALGAPLDRFLPARFRAAHRGHVEKFGRTGVTSRRMGDATTLWALRADGEEFPIEASISQVEDGGSFFTVILRDITRRRQAEEAQRRYGEELRALSAQVLEAREEEKTRVARELHDELGQQLTALKMDLAALRARLPAGEASAQADRMGQLLDQTVASMRRISADLRPLMLDDLGLTDAAAWLVEDFAKRSSVELRFERPEGLDAGQLDRAVANTVYRALQESLTNIARHSGARHAWIRLAAENGALHLEVEDDGRGIAPGDLAKAKSLGLKGMRERVAYLGGALEIEPALRGGTRLRLHLPLRRGAAP